ncbi:unnamed protein product [Spirodela intermedia]|uniref:Uncharacterized protein n=1 Tax=Spirodela intermedia TaxID=51605 RepID=A0A7I8J0F2_SPIIN|nr:unnamed protein product [Spirodela intermedia]CAA6663519.1 unnamed protein product [Spirodela intermedia]
MLLLRGLQRRSGCLVNDDPRLIFSQIAESGGF